MAHGQALALDRHVTRRERLQQQVRGGLVEEVDVVNVQHAAVGSGEEARLEDGLAGTDRLLHVDRAQQPVLQHVQRDLHKGRVDDLCLQRIWIDLASVNLGFQKGVVLPRLGVDVEGRVLEHLDGREQLMHRPRHDGLCCAARAGDHDAADSRVDATQQQSRLDCLLADDGGEREDGRAGCIQVGEGGAGCRRRLGCRHIRVHRVERGFGPVGGITSRGGAGRPPGAGGGSDGSCRGCSRLERSSAGVEQHEHDAARSSGFAA
mmetsp:Transcript_3278/g.10788  ORF Transcript_3278/g.10788 Transcript_3278/m.10788 type:complete len:263 (+) Transcript_3278:518-1306(+)